ncbi:MAG TPA: hypothetical protein VMG82_14025 [Candidatus Sulfotelmatobacter sp.]|nr:hypothetical protein [Candidatus Sulfotelmatobacter sp.]
MAERPFLFEIYRLNVVDEEGMLPFLAPIRTNAEILRVLSSSTESRFDRETESRRGTFKWSLREFATYDLDDDTPWAATLTFARSVITQTGQTVTDSSIEKALSQISPPYAEIMHLFFNLERHLVAVEYNSVVMATSQWRSSLHEILDAAAHSLEFQSSVRLEPVPREDEVLVAFRSFQRLTRLRVRLRIPNPELDRRTERLRRELESSGIRDYTQDMKNPRGLSQSADSLPFATAAMAQAGYKDGDITLTGYRNGKLQSIRTGGKAIRGRIDGLKSYIRGMAVNARTKEARTAIASILEEVDRLAEPPIAPDSATAPESDS